MARILIVDDSATMRQILMRGIRQAGFNVESFAEAGDGLEGLEALETETVDLILTDINMPRMDGLDFVKSVRERHGTDTPIVMVTHEGAGEVIAEAEHSGASGHIKKPLSPDQILDTLGPHLE